MGQIGFDVTGIAHHAAAAGNLAADLRAIRSAWAAATQSPEPALGMPELVTAFESMRQAWDAQFGVYIDVVSKVSGHLAETAADYDTAEKTNTANARAAGR